MKNLIRLAASLLVLLITGCSVELLAQRGAERLQLRVKPAAQNAEEPTNH